MLTRIQGNRRSPLHGTFATLQQRKKRNCFYSRFHLSAENMPSRFLRGRRRRGGGRHAPRSFPNNLERCTKHERRSRREERGSSLPFKRRPVSLEYRAAFPLHLTEPCRRCLKEPLQKRVSGRGDLFQFPVDVHRSHWIPSTELWKP